MSLYALSPLTSLSWMCAISDLAKPECSIAWTADTKMDVMLASPFAVAILIVSYGLSKWFIHHKDPSTNSHDLVFKCEAMSVGIFFVGSSFLLKGMLGGFDCSTDLTNGKDYLDIDPGIECWGDEHTSIRNKAAIGLTMWCVMLASISCRFLSDGGKYRYSFLTTKLEDRWFWWELFLLARKILIMACGLFNTRHTARGWYCGSLVIIVALAVHAYARPYKDSLVDFCESASLMSTLIIFQSGMIFNSSIDHTGLLSWFLEKLSIFLVLAVATLGLLSQADALIQNAHDSVHFSKQFVQRRSRGSLRKACAQLGIGLEFLRPDHALDKQIPPKVKEMSERLSNLGPQSLVNSCCAFWTSLRFHMGSAAFGACIIATMNMIRIAFEYVHHKIEVASPDLKNRCWFKMITCMLRCCLACLEKCIRFLSKQSYIYTAIKGNGFCFSAVRSYTLMFNNLLRFGATNSITAILMILGKAMVCLFSMMFGYAWVNYSPTFNDRTKDTYVTSSLFISICILMLAYLVAEAFFNIFHVAIDTSLLCYCMVRFFCRVLWLLLIFFLFFLGRSCPPKCISFSHCPLIPIDQLLPFSSQKITIGSGGRDHQQEQAVCHDEEIDGRHRQEG